MPIVTLPDGVTGPALQTTQVINAKWDAATEWFNDAISLSNKSLASVGTAPTIPVPSVSREDMDLQDRADPIKNLSFDDPNAALAYFNSTNRELAARIDDAFHEILQVAFPDMAVFGATLAWCNNALRQGGTGINAAVETALWERGRARIATQAERDIATTTEQYARAGWPLPPGAMLHATAMIRQDARDKLAEQSRDIAIKSFEAEVENVRFAVKSVGDLFSQALQAVGDYVKTVMLGPQTAMQLANSMAGLKNESARTLVSLYQAQNAAIDPIVRMNIADAELKERAAEASARARTDTAQLRVQTVLANVKMVGDAAAASLNGIASNVGNSMSTSVAM